MLLSNFLVYTYETLLRYAIVFTVNITMASMTIHIINISLAQNQRDLSDSVAGSEPEWPICLLFQLHLGHSGSEPASHYHFGPSGSEPTIMCIN